RGCSSRSGRGSGGRGSPTSRRCSATATIRACPPGPATWSCWSTPTTMSSAGRGTCACWRPPPLTPAPHHGSGSVRYRHAAGGAGGPPPAPGVPGSALLADGRSGRRGDRLDEALRDLRDRELAAQQDLPRGVAPAVEGVVPVV